VIGANHPETMSINITELYLNTFKHLSTLSKTRKLCKFEIDESTTCINDTLDMLYKRSSEHMEENGRFFTILQIGNITENTLSFKLHLEVGVDSTYDKIVQSQVNKVITVPTDARWEKDSFYGSYIDFQ
jgi:hypothetical protein